MSYVKFLLQVDQINATKERQYCDVTVLIEYQWPEGFYAAERKLCNKSSKNLKIFEFEKAQRRKK